MEISTSASTSVSEDINNLKKFYPELMQCDDGVMQAVSLNYLENNVIALLCDTLASNSILPQLSDKKRNGNVEKEDKCEEANQHHSTIITSRKCLAGAANSLFSNEKTTFAVSTDGEYEVSEDQEVQDNLTAAVLKQSGYGSLAIDGEDEQKEDDLTAAVMKQYGYESVELSNPKSMSPVTPLKLVSALKGSRKKQGMPAKKLTVTWASDVYDPPPSASTIFRNKKSLSKNGSKKNYDTKKNGKNKQKGKPSKGGVSKDKKQAQKHGGSSNKCHQFLEDGDGEVFYDKPSAELGDFDVGSPDSYCGSSFLKKSGAKLPLSVTEAT